jgi:P27 family predicted phage terminase small subunit
MTRRSRADLEVQPVRLVPSAPLDLPPPPEHLSPAMRTWWNQVMADYALDPHHLHLLEAACDAWDRMVQARETLAKEGLSVATKSGAPKRHPAADIERDSRLAFARLLRELDLDADPPVERPAYRPPPLRSNRRR